ncbi:MAG: aminopeptidase N [Gammaproteobacteria bacterium]|nr:aminopeptidase N [Gammaproteobacteria bacterium]
MPKPRVLAVALLVIQCQACSLSTQSAIVQRDSSPVLTAEQARYRSGLVSDVRYHIDLALDADAPEYIGTVVAEFTLATARSQLSLDFKGGTVYAVEINSIESKVSYNGAWIGLESQYLQAGRNKVVIHYSHPYSSDGAGLQRTRDSEDGRVYVYTHFEPYDANRLFPCFDQPDLKARYRLTVSAPADWEVVSATSASAVTIMSPGIREWEFAESQPFSTYLFALHAGPYTVWEAQSGSVPLRLFARPTLARYVNADEWFELTRNGFGFYEKLFGIAYPFGKYDQLIVPDLNIGAMENVAAVTYNEFYVTRTTPTAEQRQRHAEVLLHEMAHMWFGNLVTPRWWDGLWLKEAFATHVSNLALQATTDFDNPAQRFFAGAKQRGYRADERQSRHPIDVQVEDTHIAFANFDAITYQKGAAALTQLSHFVGADAFAAGSRRYLADHAGGNTTLEDFITALEQSAGIDLAEWKEAWLRQAGVNTLSAKLQCQNGRISSLVLEQSAPGGVPLRPHRLQVALFDHSGRSTVIAVAAEGEHTAIDAAAGQQCPAMTLVNHGDWSFVRTDLDSTTLRNFGTTIIRIDDALARAMLWQSLAEMVRNARFSLSAYTNMVAQHAINEQDNLLALQLSRSMGDMQHFLLRAADDRKPLAAAALQQLEAAAWQALTAAPAGSQRQKIWLDAFVRLAMTPSHLQHLEAFLDGHRIPPGIDIDTDRRWDILTRLNAFAFGDHVARTDVQSLRDQSDRGRHRAISANVIRPDAQIKKAWIDGILGKADFMPLGQLRYGMRALFPLHQRALHEMFADQLLSALGRLGDSRDDAFLREFVRLIPRGCSDTSIQRLQGALAQPGKLHPILERGLRDTLEGDRRCLAMVQADANRQ